MWTKEQLEIIILSVLKDANAGGMGYVDKRMEQLRVFSTGLQDFMGVTADATPDYLMHVNTIGDAVVAAVESSNRFVSARIILERIRTFGPILSERDERMKRRKVSQGLYTQKDKRLISVRVNTTTVWGLKSWTDIHGTPTMDHMPDVADLKGDNWQDK